MTFLSTADMLIIAKWLAITTVALGAVTTIAFIAGWGWRFRLVGVTSFMGVIAASVFALGVSFYPRIVVEGAERFSLVYDNGGAQVVVALPAKAMTEETMEATLRQAAYDTFSPGRLSQSSSEKMLVRARAMVHRDGGASEPLFLGQVKRSMLVREDENMEIEIYPKNLAQLPEAPLD